MIESKTTYRTNRHGEALANVSFRVPKSEWEVWRGYLRSKGVTLTQLIRTSIEEYLGKRQ